MRRVVSCLFFSLDGITQGPNRRVFDFDAELAPPRNALIASQGAVLLGRVTYQERASYWPASNHEPFASFINSTPKYVASTTLTEVSQQNTTLIKGSPAEQIVQLKAQASQNIGVHSSALLRDGLIDELRPAVPTVIVGTGERLFDCTSQVRRQRLAQAQQTSTGVMLRAYHPLPA
jgi:dihydrofolate reductase